MAILLAPVWSLGWKIAIIVLLIIAIIVCAAIVAYSVITFRRTKHREAEDEFRVRDDGGFGKIVKVSDYGIKMPEEHSRHKDGHHGKAQPPVLVNYAQSVQPTPVQYVQAPILTPEEQYLAPSTVPVPPDISARVGYNPGMYQSTYTPVSYEAGVAPENKTDITLNTPSAKDGKK